MNLFLHIFIHFSLAVVAGLAAWKLVKGNLWLCLSAGVLAGVLVDLDHFIDYFLAFGLTFNDDYFAQGFQFLKTNKMYVLFHGWEFVAILSVAAYFFRIKKLVGPILLALSFGLFIHLATDVALNDIPARSYLISYRIYRNFDIEYFVSKEHFQRHQQERLDAGF